MDNDCKGPPCCAFLGFRRDKVTPELVKEREEASIEASSETRNRVASARRITVFCVSKARERD